MKWRVYYTHDDFRIGNYEDSFVVRASTPEAARKWVADCFRIGWGEKVDILRVERYLGDEPAENDEESWLDDD